MNTHTTAGLRILAFALALTLALPMRAPAQAISGTSQKLRIVGGLAGPHQYTRNEEPFWTKELPRLTQGRYAADIVPFDRAGVPGAEMLRLLQLGVVPFGTALLSNLSTQYPEYAAPDLAGLNPDMATLKKTLAAFRPYLEKSLREQHGVEVLAVYVYPAQVLFCKRALASLADLQGRRVRVSSATQADFMTALGATPVLATFTQLVPHMASGNTECAITSTMGGNHLGLHEVTTHLHTLPLTWGLAIFGANQAAWHALPADLRAVLANELPKLEAAIWVESERETAEGVACNRGLPNCTTARKGNMTEVASTKEDDRKRRDILLGTVLPRWLQRCNPRCKELWDNTIGQAHGIVAPPAK